MLLIKLVPHSVRPTAAEDQAVKVLSATIDPQHQHISRLLLQFDESSELDGHPMPVCRAKVTLAKALHVPSFHLEGRASTMREAAELVADAILGAVRRGLEGRKRHRGLAQEAQEAQETRAQERPRESASRLGKNRSKRTGQPVARTGRPVGPRGLSGRRWSGVARKM